MGAGSWCTPTYRPRLQRDGPRSGVVLVDSAAAGAWETCFASGVGLRVDLDLFERPGASLARAIEERFEEMVALLGALSVLLG